MTDKYNEQVGAAEGSMADTVGDSTPVDGRKAAAMTNDPVEDIPDLAIDGDDPYPAGLPDRGGSTLEPTAPNFRDEEYVSAPGRKMETSALALMTSKLPAAPVQVPGDVEDPGDLAASVLPASMTSGYIRVPIDQTRRSMFCIANPARAAPVHIEQRAHEHHTMGQLLPCHARLVANGVVEILTGQLDYLAARQRAEAGEENVTLFVDIGEFDDATACQIAYADALGSLRIAPIDFARWAVQAIRHPFQTQRALAAALGLDESNVTRLLHVAKAVDLLSRVIIDEANVSRNQADRFMSLCADKAIKAEIRSFVSQMKPASAAKVFSAIFDRFGTRRLADRNGVDVVGDDDTILGNVRASAAGTVLITLAQSAGSVEVPTLITFIEAALTRLRADI